MFDSALAFDRYRLEVVRSWPDSAVKDKLLASIEYSLRRTGQRREHLDSRASSGGTGHGEMAKPIHKIPIIDGPDSPAPS